MKRYAYHLLDWGQGLWRREHGFGLTKNAFVCSDCRRLNALQKALPQCHRAYSEAIHKLLVHRHQRQALAEPAGQLQGPERSFPGFRGGGGGTCKSVEL